MKLLKITVTALIAVISMTVILLSSSPTDEQFQMEYKPFKVFTMPLPDSTDYVEWKEEIDTVYTDDYKLTHVKFKQINNI